MFKVGDKVCFTEKGAKAAGIVESEAGKPGTVVVVEPRGGYVAAYDIKMDSICEGTYTVFTWAAPHSHIEVYTADKQEG
jgi:hypothetical protein